MVDTEVRKYRKKPIVIEAVQFDGTPGSAVEVFNIFDIPRSRFIPAPDLETGTIAIVTMEGEMIASAGDWIVKGTAGEFYPVKDHIFSEIYEAVSE